MEESVEELSSNDGAQDMKETLKEGITALGEATDWIVAAYGEDRNRTLAAAAPYLRLFGTVAGGWVMARSLLEAEKGLASKEGDAAFFEARRITARFYADAILPHAPALARIVMRSGPGALELAEERF